MILIAAAMLAAGSQFEVYSRDQNWTVMRSKEGCALLGYFDNDADIFLTYRSRVRNSKLVITDPSLKSADETKSYKLGLLFVRGSTIDRSWETVAFDGNVFGQRHGIEAWVNSDDMLESLANSSTLALEKDGQVLLSYSLMGTAKVIASLKKCAREVDKSNPADPLDGLEERKN